MRNEKEEWRRRGEEVKSRAIAETVAEPLNGVLVMEASIGKVQPACTNRREHRKSDSQDRCLEDSTSSEYVHTMTNYPPRSSGHIARITSLARNSH